MRRAAVCLGLTIILGGPPAFNSLALARTDEPGQSADAQPSDTTPQTTTDQSKEDQPDDSLTDQQLADFELWKAGVIESTSRIARRTAAIKLIQSNWPEATAFLVEVLQSTERVDVILSIADAMIELDQVPGELLSPLLDVYTRLPADQREFLTLAVTSFPPDRAIPMIDERIRNDAGPIEMRVALIDLLSRFVEVETVDALIPCLDEFEPTAVREAAKLALESVTGVTHIGDSRLRWQDWWNDRRDEGREGLLAASLERVRNELREASRREREVVEDRKALVSSLIRWIERAHALTPQDRRPPLVVSLLEDKRQDIRILGLRLVERAMSNAEPITAEIADAVAKCFDDPVATIRAEAARRLLFISAERAASLAAERLTAEESTEVRTAYFTVFSRQPVAAAAPVLVERYTTSPGRSSIPAAERKALIEAILAAYKARLITDQAIIDQVAETGFAAVSDPTDVNGILAQLHSLELELLGWSSDDAIRALPRLMLTLPPNAIPQGADAAVRDARLAAARGFAASGFDLDPLYSMAHDPDVHPIAFNALTSRNSRIEALHQVLDGFAAPDPETRLRDVTRLMVDLPMMDWLSADDLLASSGVVTLDQRAAWLQRVLNGHNSSSTEGNGGNDSTRNGSAGSASENSQGEPGTDSQPADDGILRRAICIRLAEVELRRGEPELALDALRAAPAAESDRLQADRLRAIALVAAGQAEAVASERQSDLTIWLEALDVLERRREKLSMSTDPDADPDTEPETGGRSAQLSQRMRTIAAFILDSVDSAGADDDRPAITLSEAQRARLIAILEGGDDAMVNADDIDGDQPPLPSTADAESGSDKPSETGTDGGGGESTDGG